MKRNESKLVNGKTREWLMRSPFSNSVTSPTLFRHPARLQPATELVSLSGWSPVPDLGKGQGRSRGRMEGGGRRVGGTHISSQEPTRCISRNSIQRVREKPKQEKKFGVRPEKPRGILPTVNQVAVCHRNRADDPFRSHAAVSGDLTQQWSRLTCVRLCMIGARV